MRNIQDDRIDAFAGTFGRHGLPLTLGRALGLLLLSEDPLGLDDIADRLEMSKSAASRTLRDLEQLGVVRRRGTAGSRRVEFEAHDSGDALLVATVSRLRDLRELFQSSARGLGDGKARRRLAAMGELYAFATEICEDAHAQWRTRGSKRKSAAARRRA